MAKPVSAAKSKGVYAPLAAQYYLDDAILEAGPPAELMWVRILSFLASVPSDGFVTERQLRIVGTGLRDWRQRVDTLIEVELLSSIDGGYLARNWLKWNRTTEFQNRQLAADRERKAAAKERDRAVATPMHSAGQRIDDGSDAVGDIEDASQGESEPRNHADVDENSDRKTNAFRSDSGPQSSTEQSSTEQNKDSSSEVAIAPIRPDVESLLDLLDSEIQANGGKKPTRTKKNSDAMRLLIDRDKCTPEQVAAAIRWCQRDEFWRSNILSASKLREKYEQLRLAAQRKPSGKQSAPTTKADQNAALFHELYGDGGTSERTRSISASDPGIG